MADIDIFGTFVNRTSGKVAGAEQIKHKEDDNSETDVSTIIGELRHKVEMSELDNGEYSTKIAKVRVIRNENVIEFEDYDGNVERLFIPIFISGSDFSDDFSDDFYNESQNIIDLGIYQNKYDENILGGDKTVVGAINALDKKLQGIPAPARQKFRGEITLQNLLAITDAQDGDAYEVYAGYNEDGTMSMLDYEYGTTRTAGTIFERANGAWIVPTVTPDFTGVVKMNERPEKISVIKSLYTETSYKDLYGDSKAGMHIATVVDFVIDETGVYQKAFYDKGTPGQRYYSKTSEQKIVIPYARSYAQGADENIVYTGGLLTDDDYKKLKEIDKDVFVATYGTTSFNMLVKAYEDGKMLIVKYGSHNIYALEYYYGNEFRFSKVDISDYMSDAVVSCISMRQDNGWSNIIYNKTLENRGNRVSSTELKPSLLTDIKYLSALAVKTLIEEYIAELASVASSGDYNDLINKPTIPSAVTDAVKYSAQSLTDAQKTQARQNIGAGEVLTFDMTPTANSANPVTSAGIHTSLSGKMDTDASNATNAAVQNLLDTLTYTSNALTIADSLVMKIDNADEYKEIPITSLADYINAPNLSLSANPTNDEKRLLFLSSSSTKTISAILSPLSVDTVKHSVMGENCSSSANYSFSFGYGNTAGGTGPAFIGGGNNNNISGPFAGKAIVGGEYNSVSGSAGGIFVGHHNSVTGQNSAVISGHHNVVDNSNCVAMGEYSLGLADARTQHAGYGSRILLLKIGNGNENANSNAFEVWDNGKAFLGGEFVARKSFIVLRYDDYGWSVVNHSGDIAVQRDLARTKVLLTLTKIANTQEAYENFMINHSLDVQYTYYAQIDGAYAFQKYTGADILSRVRVVYTGTYGIELTRNASIFKDLHPAEYISVSFDCLY